MATPRQAASTPNGRYYTHPVTGQQLASVTNVIGSTTSKPGLEQWKVNLTAAAAWDNVAAMVAAVDAASCDPRGAEPCGACRGCIDKAIKSAARAVSLTAADLGTRVHERVEARLTGAQFPDDPETVPYLTQFDAFVERFGLGEPGRFEAAEMTVADPALGYAGTLDGLYWLPLAHTDGAATVELPPWEPRRLWALDVKTSATAPAARVYATHALQLAALRHATEAWLPNGDTIPMPVIEGGAILNLRQRSWRLIPLPTGPRERDVFRARVTAALWDHGTGTAIDKGTYAPFDAPPRPAVKMRGTL